ncbi:MAG: hypothetical protein HQK65_22685 [Desulfamplus sp.]|nr:hypothetical protein [Desulfamplus sp.]
MIYTQKRHLAGFSKHTGICLNKDRHDLQDDQDLYPENPDSDSIDKA